MNAKDFSAMMKTPSRPVGSSEMGMKTIRDQKRGGPIKKKAAMLPPPKAKGKKASSGPAPKRSTKMVINGTPYRDRAAERSLGVNPDYNDNALVGKAAAHTDETDQMIQKYTALGVSASSGEFANPEELDPEQQAIARQKKISSTIAQSKYLGGDEEHTHEVKGLDFQLLAKRRLMISQQQAKVAAEPVKPKEAEIEGVRTALGMRMDEVLAPTVYKKRDTFIIFKEGEEPRVAVKSLGISATRGRLMTPSQPTDLIQQLADLRLPKSEKVIKPTDPQTTKNQQQQQQQQQQRPVVPDCDIFDDAGSLHSDNDGDEKPAVQLAEDNIPAPNTGDAELSVAFDEADLNSSDDDDDDRGRPLELTRLSRVTPSDSYAECFPDTFSRADQSGLAAGIEVTEGDPTDPEPDSRTDRRRLDLIKKSSRASKLERESRAINKMFAKKDGEARSDDVKRAKLS
eukprot:TRINITY_DN973_c0_g2_i1.p1 TRINITY_DN973_c0_g2~~TRINITY_DN973_c0_g2_i1.p1  ORF type:complete len:481 (+),score=125.78 TRINITY_DN973_c0_g2_i1:77-1444(+)